MDDDESGDDAMFIDEGVRNEIGLDRLVAWSSYVNETAFETEIDKSEKGRRPRESSPFPIDEDLNSRVYLWFGDISTLQVDVIVNSTNERLSSRLPLSKKIHEAAGPALALECDTLQPCRTGEVKPSKGYNLPCKRVYHTVSPKYNKRYRTAAKGALHFCYRASLQLLVVESFSTIAFPVINLTSRGFPHYLGAHLALRTVRRQLEHLPSNLQVVFTVDSLLEQEVYERAIRLYFPRSPEDLERACYELPNDVGNEFGETVIEDRMISISSGPSRPGSDDEGEDQFPVLLGSQEGDENVLLADLRGGALSSFASMSEDVDVQKKKVQMDDERLKKSSGEKEFAKIVKRARRIDLSTIEEKRACYRAGKDAAGREIIVLIGMNYQEEKELQETLFALILKTLEEISGRPYVVLYFHSMMKGKKSPEVSFVKRIYDVVPKPFKKNIKGFYVVHPTFALKANSWWFVPLVKRRFWKKFQYLDSLREVFRMFPPEQLRIPEEIHVFDRTLRKQHNL